MVLLTMTPAIVQAIETSSKISEDALSKLQPPSEPSLADATVGNPISHSQLINLSKLLKDQHHTETDGKDGTQDYYLNALLKGSKIYVPPPPPKKEPVRHSCSYTTYNP
jgi:TMEM199 family protein